MVDNELKLVIVPDFGRFQSELKKLGGQMENFGITGSKKEKGKGGESTQGGGILELLPKIALGIGIIAAFYEAVGPILSAVIKVLAAILLTLLRPFLEKGVAFFGDWAPHIIDAVEQIAVGFEQDVQAPFFESAEFFNKSFAERMGIVAVNLPEAIYTVVRNLFRWADETARGLLKGGLNFLVGIGTWIWDSLTKVLGVAWIVLSGLGTWIWDNLMQVFSFVWNNLIDLGSWLRNNFMQIFRNAFNALVNGINTLIGYIESVIRKLPGLRSFSIAKLGTIDTPVTSAFNTPYAFTSQNAAAGLKAAGNQMSYSPTYNISADVDGNALKRMLEEQNRNFLFQLRQQGTLGGRNYNG